MSPKYLPFVGFIVLYLFVIDITLNSISFWMSLNNFLGLKRARQINLQPRQLFVNGQVTMMGHNTFIIITELQQNKSETTWSAS